MNLLSHVLIGVALFELLALEPLGTILGSIAPDLDYLFGITHRTVTHSLLFLAIIVLLLYRKNKREAVSFGIGFATHLAFDLMTTQGVQLLWPLDMSYSYSLFDSGNTFANLAVVIISLVLIWNREAMREKLSNVTSERLRFAVFVTLGALILSSVPYTYIQIMMCSDANLASVLSNASFYGEKCVTLSGTVCSSVHEYSNSAGITYQIFSLCEGENNITVWKLSSVSEKELEKNDRISITGLFTTRYLNSSGYELYKIKNVGFFE